ncbi:DUF6750 family protein [Candidatus Williamhamiltonella defendens]|uniref:Uncharacterized protein n=1 Tax=Candidatus Williamhamiltonella defendens TaxID=138072 RepID=A0A2D3TG24_9ENTR|nr:DUF6750 family protein [Candidatus Hamiltonella defensa]ATW34770.1 hypothetical protein BJP43_10250 [Candidatus Hamiltonella defensa]
MRSFHNKMLFFYVHVFIFADRIKQKLVQGLIALIGLCTAQAASADEDIVQIINNITGTISSIRLTSLFLSLFAKRCVVRHFSVVPRCQAKKRSASTE